MNKSGKFLVLKFMGALIVSGIAVSSLSAKNEDDASIRLEALSKLTKTISTVEKYYVDDIKFKEIIDKAISGLMQNLDAHSSFLNEKAFKDMQVQTNGEFGGLGITVGMKDGALTVISPIEDRHYDRRSRKQNARQTKDSDNHHDLTQRRAKAV